MTPDVRNAPLASATPPGTGQPPAPLIGFAVLFRMALAELDLIQLRTALINRAAQNPDDANTLLDLSTVLQLTGNREVGLQVQAQALQMQQVYHLSPHAGADQVRLLAIMGPGDLMANTPVECLVEDSGVALDLLYVGPGLPLPPVVPDHDVAIVCVAESDENRPLLALLSDYLQAWPRPVLNATDRILSLSRELASARLQSAPGIITPASARIGRSDLHGIGTGARRLTDILEGGHFPIIVRPAGSHAGHGLIRLDQAEAVAAYLRDRPESDFSLTQFVDYRQGDDLYRKYRIVLIDGRPYVSHLAISEHWMVHYLNARMSESAAKRAEEAEAMQTFDAGFGRRHRAAFAAITERMGLDYLGIDCAEAPDGRLLIFEVDTSMIVHAMDPVDLFPYKQPQMRKVFSAFRDMLARRTAGLPRARPRGTLDVRAQAARALSAVSAA